MNECERRLVRNLKDREVECQTLQKAKDLAEQEKRDLSSKIEFLERMMEDKSQELNRTR